MNYRMTRARKMKGLLQSELAKATGISRGWISEMETGTRNPSRAQMEILSEALGQTVYQLFGRQKDVD